jgi:PIN domain nuclease of toxin-antitoxin system
MRWCYDAEVRTTIDLPDDLHRQAVSIARDTSRTLSETVADLMRRGLGLGESAAISRSERTGLPVVHLGTVITTDDVRALDDDQ